MVFIGESGSGKSTCINYFANYFTGSNFTETDKYSKMKIVIPNKVIPQVNFQVGDRTHSEANVYDNTRSQTQECITYSFTWGNKSIRVVDTPGFNDTNINNDDINIKKILTKMAELPFVNAIIVTMNGTTSRLSTGLKATLAQLRGSLPDCVFTNLFFILTKCTEDSQTFSETLLSDFKPPKERIFRMQNSLFCQQDQSRLSQPRVLQRMVDSWEDSIEVMKNIMNMICSLAPASVAAFEKMRIKRESMVSDREMLILKQKSLINIMKTLEIEMERLKNAQQAKSENAQFFEKKEIDVIEIETKSYYSTICAQHGDVSICHENCSISRSTTLNLDHFKKCAAADGNNCRHCKCGMNRHFHSYQIPVTKRKPVEQLIQGKHTAFLKASCEAQTIQNYINAMQPTIQQFKVEINTIRNQILTNMRELKQICTHFNFVEEMSSIVEKLRKEGNIANSLSAKQEFEATANAIAQLIAQLT
ncbi:unnamed protein product [Rotaria socialis]|nr:unnamed protein product [Rotaria socialis]CAF4473685.1 unnamed protein product [Rotaria socialis]